MTLLDRIAALRSEVERIARMHGCPDTVICRCQNILRADDIAASAPLPDLPLAEGSQFVEEYGVVIVRDADGRDVFFRDGRVACEGEADSDRPRLLDVLALARRKGLV